MDVRNEKEEAKRLQGVRELRKDEEVAWPDWEEARQMENGEWRLEPKRAEVPEIIIVSDAVEVISVDQDGESCHEPAEAKLPRRRREMHNEGEEIGSPKRKSRIRRNTGVCERRKECGAGRGGREDLRTERSKRSAKAPVSL